MRRPQMLLIPVFFALMTSARGADKEWTTIKGKIVYDPNVALVPPKEIIPTADKAACLANGKFYEDDFIVDPKTRAMKDVLIWIEPANAPKRKTPFPQELIHPTLAKPAKPTVEIDQPCCQFIPHIVTARVGQDFIIKNSAPVAHNAKYDTTENGGANPLIPSKGEYVLKNLKLEDMPFQLSCSIHPFMKAQVAIFDHPYYALTDEKGEFEIKLAPQGKFTMYVWKEGKGWNGGSARRKGTPLEIKGETLDLKVITFTSDK